MSHTICQKGTIGTKSSWMLVHLVERKFACKRSAAADMWKNTKWGFYQLLLLLLRPAASLLEVAASEWLEAGRLVAANALQLQCIALQSGLSVPLPKPWAYTACFKANAKSMSLQSSLQYPTSRNHAEYIVVLDNNWTYCTVYCKYIWQGEHWVADRNLISHLPAQIYNVSVILCHPLKCHQHSILIAKTKIPNTAEVNITHWCFNCKLCNKFRSNPFPRSGWDQPLRLGGFLYRQITPSQMDV